MDTVRSFRGLPLIRVAQLQLVDNVNPLDHEDVALFFDLANRIGPVRLRVRRYFARLKGAAKCSS